MQSNQNRKFLSGKDIIIVAVILAAAAGFYLFNNIFMKSGAVAEADIYYDMKIVKTVRLTPGLNETFTVPGQPNVTVEVVDGKIHFLESTCRDKICIKEGFLSRPGETAACLPNRVAIKIVDAGGSASGLADTYIN
ncbi:hypothetical protein SAMN02745823_03031 [Sporobacter termitidis DSM 10068]|uniref:Uncharacterized protein n=1 Tax=Sporobacter termitidis DSM 10068 TaxID=1123282 RepID=A0A1M5Z173_9FIRM|nr:NusG domain II-containing protein [Sporobacter termitidis]SHI17643.1 hypothetical protein SAMN02745823_03031 [Sporobacter termitidis DSM 10068]